MVALTVSWMYVGSNLTVYMLDWFTDFLILPIHKLPPSMGQFDFYLYPSAQCMEPLSPSAKVCSPCYDPIPSHLFYSSFPVAMGIILLSRPAMAGICRRSTAYFMGTMPATEPPTTWILQSSASCPFFWSVITVSYDRKCSNIQYSTLEKHKIVIHSFLSSNCNSIPFSLTQDKNF